MESALETDADAVIYDLEDAIPDEHVRESRARIASVASDASGDEREHCVRINGPQSGLWKADLEAAIDAGASLVVVPMVESAAIVKTIHSVAVQYDGTTPELLLTIETPRGLFAAPDIATVADSMSAVTGLSFGLADMTKAIGATGTPEGLESILMLATSITAAAGRMQPYMTVYQDYSDLDGLRETAERAKSLGFVGQKAIHPDQIAVINDVYTPTRAEIEQATRLVEAFDDAVSDSVVVDGIFLDTAVVDQYRRVLERARVVSE